MHSHTKDQGSTEAHLHRIRRAVKWAAAGVIAFGCIATVDLTSFPGSNIWSALGGFHVVDVLRAIEGYSILFVLLYWGTSPPVKERRVVFALGCVVFVLLGRSSAEFRLDDWTAGNIATQTSDIALALSLPAIAAFTRRGWFVIRRPASMPAEARYVLWLVLLVAVLTLLPSPGLNLTESLHPLVYDLYAAYWDRAAGLAVTPALRQAVDDVPGLSGWIGACYGLTPAAFLVLSINQRRGCAAYLPTAAWMWVVLTGCALIAYHFFPVVGPAYVFGSDRFVQSLGDLPKMTLRLVSVRPVARNGMPSMHFGWMLAVTIVWWRSCTPAWSKLAMAFVAASAAAATLYLGEHYLVDLVVAVPFVLAAIALSTSQIPWVAMPRWATVVAGFGTWIVWVILLRTRTPWFVEHPWSCWALLAATAAVVWKQSRWLRDFELVVPHPGSELTDIESTKLSSSDRSTRKLGLLFFISGAAALVYQVLFAKELALVFGSTATATFTVLTTFLGGMAIGSLIGGIVATRLAKPLRAYAFVELGIGAFCVATPAIFSAIQMAYVWLAQGLPPSSIGLQMLRMLLGAGALLVPTVLMGTTLPLLAQVMNPRGERIGRDVAWLYFVNTAGAALGALLTSYWVIPALGVRSTTLVAALLNALVALAAIELSKSWQGRIVESANLSPSRARFVNTKLDRPVLFAAWLALGLGGTLSLGLEVVYVHLLSIVAGNSVYAFGLMLATFLIGLSGGGEIGRRLVESSKVDRAAALALIQTGLALFVAIGAIWWNAIPEYFGSFAGYPLTTSFASRESVRGLVCALVMIPPTLFIGASYTVAMDLATSLSPVSGIRMLGWGAALNTFGNIVGVLLFGFVILPVMGGLAASKLIAGGALLIAAVARIQAVSRPSQWAVVPAAILAVGAIAMSPAQLDYESLSTGANVYFGSQSWGKVIDHAESIDGGLTSVAQAGDAEARTTTLLTNGKFQGNDASGGEMRAQVGFAAAPLLHQPSRGRALVIGYGTGVTSRVFSDAGFANVDIAELSDDIVRLANQHLQNVNDRVSTRPDVKLHITDGRNFLLLSREQYDIISIEITSIWFAGAASLYNQDFYRLAKRHLRQGGVLQQWIQLHRLTPEDLLYIVGTLRSEFRFVSVYVLGGQGILVATNDRDRANPTPSQVRALDDFASMRAVKDVLGASFGTVMEGRLLDPDATDGFLKRVGVEPELWVSTDNNLRLEYSTPRANVNDPVTSFERNMFLLKGLK